MTQFVNIKVPQLLLYTIQTKLRKSHIESLSCMRLHQIQTIPHPTRKCFNQRVSAQVKGLFVVDNSVYQRCNGSNAFPLVLVRKPQPKLVSSSRLNALDHATLCLGYASTYFIQESTVLARKRTEYRFSWLYIYIYTRVVFCINIRSCNASKY